MSPLAMGARAAIHLIGRFDTTPRQGPRFAWSGSGIVMSFRGTGISVTLDGPLTTLFQVIIDGGAPFTVRASAKPQQVAQGLSPGEHRIEIYKRTEADQGTAQLRGIAVDDGELIVSPAPFTRCIEVIGDSITCGYGNEGKSADCDFTPETENAKATYGAFSAREFNAAHVSISFSGKGMLRDWQGNTAEQLPALYQRTIPTEPASIYGFDQYRPDVVVVNLGTNDWALGYPGEPFIDAYDKFLSRLRTSHPNAKIIASMGPMETGDKANDAVRTAVGRRNAAGDSQVYFLPFAPQREPNIGCNGHPNVVTHQEMAVRLSQLIAKLTGWSTSTPAC
jgi:lysophospholipase L1-like esterase